MTSALSETQIVHESETQRQHVRLSLPGTVQLDGQTYPIRNLCAGGIALENVKGEYKPGQILRFDLSLPFEGFSMTAPFEVEIRHYNGATGLLGARFVSVGAQQISFLNYILKSFLGGEVVNAGGILNVAARESFTKPRKAANRNAAPTLRRQIPGLLVVAALGALILLFLAQNIYNSVFIVRSREAVVAGPVAPVRATAAGTLHYDDSTVTSLVQQGQIIGKITSVAGGSAANLISPCNCYVTKMVAGDGETVAAGDEVVLLAPVSSVPWILAQTDASAAMKIKPSLPATISIFGSPKKYTGRVLNVESGLASRSRQSDAVMVKVVPDQQLPVDYINRLAVVTFSTH